MVPLGLHEVGPAVKTEPHDDELEVVHPTAVQTLQVSVHCYQSHLRSIQRYTMKKRLSEMNFYQLFDAD